MKPRHAVLGLFLWLLGPSASCTSNNPEFPTTGTCNLGDRQCADPPRSPPVAMVCGRDATDALGFIEEPCPASTQCQSGQCNPTQGLPSCHSQTECAAGQVCVPLVSTDPTPVLASYCVPAASAATSPGQACAKDSDCQSYRCLQHSLGRYCLQSCATVQNCPPSSACRALSVTVNGVQGSILTCSPL
jgi:hypothetical protein